MKRLLLFPITMLLLIAAVGIAGCASEPAPAAPVSKPETAGDIEKTQEYGVIAVYKSTTVDEDGFESNTVITKNRITRTFELESEIKVNDIEEIGWIDKESWLTWQVNMTTNMFAFVLFDREGFEEWVAEMEAKGFTTEDEDEEKSITNILEGYTATKVILKFLDKDTRGLVATAEITGVDEKDRKIMYV